MALDGIEAAVKQAVPKGAKVHCIRYADDFVVTGESKELLEQEVMPALVDFLKIRGLDLSQEKTTITRIEDGFDFLGQNVRKYKGKLLIKPARKNVKSFLDKIRNTVKANMGASPKDLIKQLNPIIRGWAAYHRHIVAAQTFEYVDMHIFKCVWKWARRRHPGKSKRWIKRAHFSQGWIFSASVQEKGKSRTYALMKASQIPIRRHVKIRGKAHPYDPAYEQYFKQRKLLQRQRMGKNWSKLPISPKDIIPGMESVTAGLPSQKVAFKSA
jgi:RNA-directed DNA polymerase